MYPHPHLTCFAPPSPALSPPPPPPLHPHPNCFAPPSPAPSPPPPSPPLRLACYVLYSFKRIGVDDCNRWRSDNPRVRLTHTSRKVCSSFSGYVANHDNTKFGHSITSAVRPLPSSLPLRHHNEVNLSE